MEIFELLAKGGLAMIPIGLASLISVMIALERFSYYRGQTAKAADFSGEVNAALAAENYDRVSELCRNSGYASGGCLLAALAELLHI